MADQLAAMSEYASRAGIPNKRTSRAAEAFAPHVDEAIRALKEIRDRTVKQFAKCKDGTSSVIRAAKDSDRIAACKIMLEYGLGKPVQPTEVGGPDGAPIQHEVIVTWRAPERKQ